MSQVEIRVRSVERRIVTRFERKKNRVATSSLIAEIQSPHHAEMIAVALAAKEGAVLNIEPSIARPTQWALVQHGFEADTKVFYSYLEEEVEPLKAKLEAEFGGEFRIFAR